MSNKFSSKQIQVLLVDDHPPLRAGIRALLDQDATIDVVAEAGDGVTALHLVNTLHPTVTVLDCELPDMDGAAVAAEITAKELPTSILALSAFDNATYIQQMLAAGAKGYLLKSETSEAVLSAVKNVAAGKAYFSASVAAQLPAIMRADYNKEELAPTPREQDVLQQLAAGGTNAQIATTLDISERTVAYHVENLLNKLGVNNRTEAVVQAIRRGWLTV